MCTFNANKTFRLLVLVLFRESSNLAGELYRGGVLTQCDGWGLQPTTSLTHPAAPATTMPATPARRQRDLERSEVVRNEGRVSNEVKFTEFRMGCDAGDVAACNSLGEWYAMMRHDFATAVGFYKPGCFTNRYAQSCLNFGLITGRCRCRTEDLASVLVSVLVPAWAALAPGIWERTENQLALWMSTRWLHHSFDV